MDCFEKFYPNVPLNQYYSPFFIQRMNGFQGTKTVGQKWNTLLDAVVKMMEEKK